MLYKVGDRVRVRYDLNSYDSYHMVDDPNECNDAVEEMVRLAGEVVTISEQRHGQYRIAECGFNWTDEMFEGLENTDDDSAFNFNLDKLFEGW